MQAIIKHVPKSVVTNITKNVGQKAFTTALILKSQKKFEIQKKNTKLAPFQQKKFEIQKKNTKLAPFQQKKFLTFDPKIKENIIQKYKFNNIKLKSNIDYNQSIEIIKTKINEKITKNFGNKIKILENFKNSLKILSKNKKPLYIFYTIIISILIKLSFKSYNEDSLLDLADYFSNFTFDNNNTEEYNKLLYIKNNLNNLLNKIEDKELKKIIENYIDNINKLLEEEKNIVLALKKDNTLNRKKFNHELEELRNELNKYKNEINVYDKSIYFFLNHYNNTKYENIDLIKIIDERSELENELKNKKDMNILKEKLKEINKKYNIDINDDNDKLIKIDLALKYSKTEDKLKKLKKNKLNEKNNISTDYKYLDIVEDVINYYNFEKLLKKNENINELNNKIKKAKKNIIDKINDNDRKIKKIFQNNEYINDLILKKENNILVLKNNIDNIKNFDETFINNFNNLLMDEQSNINKLQTYKNYLVINKDGINKNYNTNLNINNDFVNSKLGSINNYINDKEKLEKIIKEKKILIDNLTIMKEDNKKKQGMLAYGLGNFGITYDKYTKNIYNLNTEIINIEKEIINVEKEITKINKDLNQNMKDLNSHFKFDNKNIVINKKIINEIIEEKNKFVNDLINLKTEAEINLYYLKKDEDKLVKLKNELSNNNNEIKQLEEKKKITENFIKSINNIITNEKTIKDNLDNLELYKSQITDKEELEKLNDKIFKLYDIYENSKNLNQNEIYNFNKLNLIQEQFEKLPDNSKNTLFDNYQEILTEDYYNYYKNKINKYGNLIEYIDSTRKHNDYLLIDNNDRKKFKDYLYITKEENKIFFNKNDIIEFEKEFDNYCKEYPEEISKIHQEFKKNKIIIKDDYNNNKIDINKKSNKILKELKFLIKNHKSKWAIKRWYSFIRDSIKYRTYYITKAVGLSFKGFYFVFNYLFNLKSKKFLSQKQLNHLISIEPDDLNPDIMLKYILTLMQNVDMNKLSRKDSIDLNKYMGQCLLLINSKNNKEDLNKILINMQNIIIENDKKGFFNSLNYYKKKCLGFVFNEKKENKYLDYNEASKIIEENFREPNIIKKANNMQSLYNYNTGMIDGIINYLGKVPSVLSNLYSKILSNPNIDKKALITDLNILANKNEITEYDILKIRDKFM
jgi:hypothetical protein